MWLAAVQRVFWLDTGAGEVSMEQLVRQLAALTQFTREIDGRLAEVGVGGIEGAVGLYRRLQSVLDGVSTADLERMTAEVAALQRTLAEIDRQLAGLHALKTVVDRVVAAAKG